MRHTLLISAMLIWGSCAYSQDLHFKSASVDDPIFEWMQYEDKEMSSKLTDKNILEVENKKDDSAAFTFIELPVSLNEDDFVVTMLIAPVKKMDFGIIFNFKNERNYSMLAFGEKQAYITDCEDGHSAVIKRSLYKVNPFDNELIKSDLNYVNDKKNLALTIERSNGKLNFYKNRICI